MDTRDKILTGAAAFGVLSAYLRYRRQQTLSSAIYLAGATVALLERFAGED